MKIVKKSSIENCHFYSSEKSLYVAWACFRNVHPVLVRPRLLSCHRFGKELSNRLIVKHILFV